MMSAGPAGYPVPAEGDTVHVGTAGELAVVLDVLQGQHDRLVLEQLGPHLADVIAGPVGLLGTLKSLAPTDQIFLVEALGPRLGELVQSAGRLRDVLATLAEPAVEE